MRSHRPFAILTGANLLAALCLTVLSPLHAQEESVLASLESDMEKVFAETRGMISHTQRVLGYATEIHEEEGGDPLVVKASAILHDIGIPKAREVHGSSSGRFQEIEGPPIARDLLSQYALPPESIDLICGIVANHHSDEDPKIVDNVEFQILWDADWLVNFPNRHRESTDEEKRTAIETIFKTQRGKELAREMFLADQERTADPRDVGTLDDIIRAYYEVVSGPAGESADRERDRTLHLPNALVGMPGFDDDGNPQLVTMTLDGYHDSAGGVRTEGFFEKEIHRVVQRFGNVAHVFSTYASSTTPDGEPYSRGINSIQLTWDGERWWIVSWIFDQERPGNSIPSQFLPGGGG